MSKAPEIESSKSKYFRRPRPLSPSEMTEGFFKRGKPASEFKEALGFNENIIEDRVTYQKYKEVTKEAYRKHGSPIYHDMTVQQQDEMYDEIASKAKINRYFVDWLVFQEWRSVKEMTRRKAREAEQPQPQQLPQQQQQQQRQEDAPVAEEEISRADEQPRQLTAAQEVSHVRKEAETGSSSSRSKNYWAVVMQDDER